MDSTNIRRYRTSKFINYVSEIPGTNNSKCKCCDNIIFNSNKSYNLSHHFNLYCSCPPDDLLATAADSDIVKNFVGTTTKLRSSRKLTLSVGEDSQKCVTTMRSRSRSRPSSVVSHQYRRRSRSVSSYLSAANVENQVGQCEVDSAVTINHTTADLNMEPTGQRKMAKKQMKDSSLSLNMINQGQNYTFYNFYNFSGTLNLATPPSASAKIPRVRVQNAESCTGEPKKKSKRQEKSDVVDPETMHSDKRKREPLKQNHNSPTCPNMINRGHNNTFYNFLNFSGTLNLADPASASANTNE